MVVAVRLPAVWAWCRRRERAKEKSPGWWLLVGLGRRGEKEGMPSPMRRTRSSGVKGGWGCWEAWVEGGLREGLEGEGL